MRVKRTWRCPPSMIHRPRRSRRWFREAPVSRTNRSPTKLGGGGDGESLSRTGDAKDAGNVVGRAGQNGRQAKALSPKIESSFDQGRITSLLLLNGFRRTGN